MATSGKEKAFDPFKTFDVSLEVRKAAEERAKMRAQLKAEWQKKSTNPFRPQGDFIFDPAIQRFSSMRVSQLEHFKATPKTAAWGLGLYVIPVAVTCYFVWTQKLEREKVYRSGEVKYTDRAFKFI